MSSDADELLKLFSMSNQLLEHDLDRVEREYTIDLGRGHTAIVSTDQSYYPQIEREIRAEAARMAPHYEVFYSLETTIRRLVGETLETAEGANWWGGGRITQKIKQDAEARQLREIDTGLTPRSDDVLDFTTFGELSELIKSNWDLFGSLFTSVKAVERVMTMLNSLRGPIAHCSPVADDEVVRLRLAVRDWFRLME